MTAISHTYIEQETTPVSVEDIMKTRNVFGAKENNDALFDIKISTVTEGMIPYFAKTIKGLPYENSLTIVNFVMSLNTEINPSTNYKTTIIDVLCRLSRHIEKDFKNMSRQDVLDFLESYRKPEASDPLHKWIGTCNLYRTLLIKFFKWLYYPEIESKKRPKPAIVENIPELKRKEQSIYKPSDMWTAEDDLLFLKYCPSKRMKCYHAISGDLSARPSEILSLKIKDITWKRVENKQYAEVLVNGKTGTRHLLLVDSIPYLKDYMNSEHPLSSNPNAPLVCGTYRSYGKHITKTTLGLIYDDYKKNVYPKLLDSPTTIPEDKQQIRELLRKPWNPYVRRHSALTRKSQILREQTLKQHAGWSGDSQMHMRYIHYLGNESNQSLLESYGIVTKRRQMSNVLKSTQCPNCNEPNKPDSKYCGKCRLVLSYDAYSETLENQKEKEDDLNSLKRQMNALMSIFGSLGQDGRQEVAKQLIEKGMYNAKKL